MWVGLAVTFVDSPLAGVLELSPHGVVAAIQQAAVHRKCPEAGVQIQLRQVVGFVTLGHMQ